MNCFLCEARRPTKILAANSECSNCGRFACYDHSVRVQQGEFLCLECYEGNETFYKEHRRLIQRPRYNVPRPPGEHPNTSFEGEDGEKAAAPPPRPPAKKSLLARLLRR